MIEQQAHVVVTIYGDGDIVHAYGPFTKRRARTVQGQIVARYLGRTKKQLIVKTCKILDPEGKSDIEFTPMGQTISRKAMEESVVWAQLAILVPRAVNALRRFDRDMTIEELKTYAVAGDFTAIVNIRGMGAKSVAQLCIALESTGDAPAWKTAVLRFRDVCEYYDEEAGTDHAEQWDERRANLKASRRWVAGRPVTTGRLYREIADRPRR